jgi:hypothetical protein
VFNDSDIYLIISSTCLSVRREGLLVCVIRVRSSMSYIRILIIVDFQGDTTL